MCLAGASSGNCAEYSFNRYPLVHKPYSELPLGAVKPKGWAGLAGMETCGRGGHIGSMA